MSGIQTYTSAPVNSNPNSNKEEEPTQATTSHPEPATSIEASTTATTEPPNTSATATAPSNAPVYATAQDAQPGAAPSLPLPTAATATAAPTTNLNQTVITTLPTTATSESPAPPQPGAVPVATSPVPQAQSPVPPPPKAGESIPQNPPSQATPAAFTQSYSYHRSPQSSHIPNSTSSPYANLYNPPAGGSQPGLPLHGGGSGGGASDIFPDDEESLMGTAKSWMQSAGTKLAEVEAEVWKRINDAHGK